MIQTLKRFISKYILLIIIAVASIAYFQILFMEPWQDDNALFFKLAHINERAGYLGMGPFGEGAYKYTATPYIPIYSLFGYDIPLYFGLALFFYVISAIFVFKVASYILGEFAGKLAGLLYSAGFIGSDGIIRLYNSIISSLSVIFISLLTYFYYRFYETNKPKWYFLSIVAFALALEFSRARTHYLVGIVFLFEIIFLAFKAPLKSLSLSIIRLIPFATLFFYYFIKNGDSRTGNLFQVVLSLKDGHLIEFYGLLSSIGRIFLPDWFTQKIEIGSYQSLAIVIFGMLVVLSFFLFRIYKQRLILISTFLILSSVWIFMVKKIFYGPILNLGITEYLYIYIGGVVIICSFLGFYIIEKKYKGLYIFLLSWILLNTAAYWGYNPQVSYESINRYHIHSLFALSCLFALIYKLSLKEKFLGKLIMVYIILFGLGNFISGLQYQNQIVNNRSKSAREFHSQLKEHVSDIKKGDIFYFDVKDDARSNFANAFSVAQMPETTAIAWRNNVDRYDIKMFTDTNSLYDDLKQSNTSIDRVFTFWYTKKGLQDTSSRFRQLMNEDEIKILSLKSPISTKEGDYAGDLVVQLEEAIDSPVPIEVSFRLQAIPADLSRVQFPFKKNETKKNIYKDANLRALALSFNDYKKNVLPQYIYTSSSQWQDRVLKNINDQDTSTVWQPDRVLWQQKKESFVIELPQEEFIDRLVWVNAFGNNTPTAYEIFVSKDSKTWQSVRSVNLVRRIDTSQLQIEQFNPTKGRFVKMEFYNTLNDDSPGIAEAYVITANFKDLDINKAEDFLSDPYTYLESEKVYKSILNSLGNKGMLQIYWKGDFSESWQTSEKSKLQILYDGLTHNYSLSLPKRGSIIDSLKFSNITTPGTLILHSLQYKIAR
ncbi:MAG: discoidin domain-containing protein [Candidatus Daviesbacteria bacterium]|nr:discoidin domain-containing protein [Candidatus Daviesbacteria bacterium]